MLTIRCTRPRRSAVSNVSSAPFPKQAPTDRPHWSSFSFTLLLWLERFPSRLTGLATLSIGTTIILCTSTTAYIGCLFVLCLVVLFSLKRLHGGRGTAPYATFLVVTLFMVPCTIVALMLIPDAWNSVTDLTSITFADKLQSQSGEERTAWNTLALVSFVETATFGAGLGTVRASSFIAALLSNVGLSGTVLFAVFLYSLLMAAGRHKSGAREDRSIGIAAVLASIAQITSATISGSSTDLGLLFSITAGLATGCLDRPYVLPRRAARSLTSPYPLEASASLMKTPMVSAR